MVEVRARSAITWSPRRRGIRADATRSPRNAASIPRRPHDVGAAPRRRSDHVISERALRAKDACQQTRAGMRLSLGSGMHTNQPPTALQLLLDALPDVDRAIQRIRRKDRHLTDQFRRSVTSCALNLAEADGSDPGMRTARLHSALGSLREARVALQIALRFRYIDDVRVDSLDIRLDEVARMTYRRIHPIR